MSSRFSDSTAWYAQGVKKQFPIPHGRTQAVCPHRLYVRERKDALWLLAVWPEEKGRMRL
jgi:hypothetical protein